MCIHSVLLLLLLLFYFCSVDLSCPSFLSIYFVFLRRPCVLTSSSPVFHHRHPSTASLSVPIVSLCLCPGLHPASVVAGKADLKSALYHFIPEKADVASCSSSGGYGVLTQSWHDL